MPLFGPSLKTAYEIERWKIWYEVYRTERDRNSPDQAMKVADQVLEGFTETFADPDDTYE
jgi:hypothetical protein